MIPALGVALNTPENLEEKVLALYKMGYRRFALPDFLIPKLEKIIEKHSIARETLFLEGNAPSSCSSFTDLLMASSQDYLKLEALVPKQAKYLGLLHPIKEEVEAVLENCSIKPSIIRVDSTTFSSFKNYIDKNMMRVEFFHTEQEKEVDSLSLYAKKYHKTNFQILFKAQVQSGNLLLLEGDTKDFFQKCRSIFDLDTRCYLSLIL